jgi:hypothetical protein
VWFLIFLRLKFIWIFSRVRGFVTNNNGFWIRWLDLLTPFLQLQSIMTAHNLWLSETRSIPHWTASVFFSAVSDSVLIYESVTSSVSAVRWLTLHSWTLNSLTTELRLPYERIYEFTNEISFITQDELKRDLQQFVCYCVYSLPRERAYWTVAQQWSRSSQYYLKINLWPHKDTASPTKTPID